MAGRPPACLACMRCDPGSGALHKISGLWALRHTLGFGRTTALYPRDIFFKRQRPLPVHLYRFDLPEKSLDFVEKKKRGPRAEATATTQGNC
jgi:hypothetical protein